MTLSFLPLGSYNTIQRSLITIITKPRETKQCQEVRKVCIETRAWLSEPGSDEYKIRRDGILLCNPQNNNTQCPVPPL